MDLVKIRGGRDTIDNVAHRDRLPSADDDPMMKFTQQYNLTLGETVALVGGAHNFGSAHGKCSGYQGQWTASPLSWFGPEGSDPTFFPDLIKEDWRWYEVCTFENDTVKYVSIPDPFANGIPEGEEEEHGEEPNGCSLLLNRAPLICEEQAMRGCDFEDGNYQTSEFPCDVDSLQMRLRSDFFLKANPTLLPFTEQFANDPDALATEFGIAYHKITHLGLDRCGLSGHGCADGHMCEAMGDNAMTKTCIADQSLLPAANEPEDEDDNRKDDLFVALLSAVLGFSIVVAIMVAVVLQKLQTMTAPAAPEAAPQAFVKSSHVGTMSSVSGKDSEDPHSSDNSETEFMEASEHVRST